MDDKTRVLPSSINADVGTQLNGIYELDERLASGGMGEVYRGHNIQTGDLVAIKIVLPEFARDQTILSLFRKEASILNHLSHDAIVRYHVFSIDAGIGRPYLAMEYVNGPSLFDIMRNGPVPASVVNRLCHRLASGLSAAHEAGTVHRDLSPDNIILPGGNVDRAKIIDFGIARSANIGGETLIGGRFAGKYNYVSPEQLGLFGGDVTEQSDIYSLGLVLAAALRGKPLEMSGSQFEVVEKRRSVPDLAGIDEGLRPIVEAMLQPDPQHRPSSMAYIARATLPAPSLEAASMPARMAPRPGSGGTAPPDQGANAPQPIPPAGAARFVEHVRPAYLSQAKPQPATPARPKAPPAKQRRMAPLIAAGLACIVIAAGAAAYLTGLISLQSDESGQSRTTKLTPAPAPEVQSDEPAIAANQTATPQPDEPATEPTIPPVVPRVEQPPIEQVPKPAPATPPIATTVRPEPVKPAPVPPPVIMPDADPTPPEPEVSETPPEAPTPPVVLPKPQAAQPPPATQPVEPPPASQETQDTAANTTPPPRQNPQPEPLAVPASPEPVVPDKEPETTQPDEEVAINVPRPQEPPGEVVDGVAERISWLRGYQGGNCFFATTLSATDKAIDIEGFGTAVEPFSEMLNAFQAKFNFEPDIAVRLIEPAQCEVTTFLRDLGDGAGDKPGLSLDRTSVPNGTPVSGKLETRGGLRVSLLLIDHKGMAFNLDQRIRVEDGKATFNIPIGLSSADQASGKVVPQIIVAVTAPVDIDAADFSKPTPASVVLPKILAEMRGRGLEGSATAKYFRLGG